MPPGYVPEGYNSSEPFNPIATNGEPFPWHQLALPDTVRPVRYTLTIHPNLTSIDVKGRSLSAVIELCNTHTHKNATNFIYMSRIPLISNATEAKL